MSKKAPSFPFYCGDWIRDPELAACSSSTRGIWIDLISNMWFAKPRGQLTGTTRAFVQWGRCTSEEWQTFLSEIKLYNFADVTVGNGSVTVKNRRMIREEKEREQNRKRVAKHRGSPECNDAVTVERGDCAPAPPSPSPSPFPFTNTEDVDSRLQMLFQKWEKNINLVPPNNVLPGLREILEWLENQIARKGIEGWLPPEKILAAEIEALADRMPSQQNIKYYQGIIRGRLKDQLEGK